MDVQPGAAQFGDAAVGHFDAALQAQVGQVLERTQRLDAHVGDAVAEAQIQAGEARQAPGRGATAEPACLETLTLKVSTGTPGGLLVMGPSWLAPRTRGRTALRMRIKDVPLE